MIEEFLGALRAGGIDPDVNELRDAIWLSSHIRVHGAERGIVGRIAQAVEAPEPADDPIPPPPTSGAQQSGSTNSHTAAHFAEGRLHAVGGLGSGGSDRVTGKSLHRHRTPSKPQRGQREMTRALRPFGRGVASRSATVLDESATVSRIAEEGLWVPVLVAERERWLDLVLVVDASPTMHLWRGSARRFRFLAERSGFFRSVRLCGLGATAAHPPQRSQVTVLLTDGVADQWRNGEMHSMLADWARRGPVAACTVLPSRMWRGTGIDAVPAGVRSRRPGGPNSELVVRVGEGADVAQGPPIPLLRLAPTWLGPWSRSVADSRWNDLALLAGPRADDPSRGLRGLPAAEMVPAFRMIASPQAFRMACISSAAWLTVPVMRVLRDLIVPEADDAHLAEVLMSDLLVRIEDASDLVLGGDTRYDFRPGVRAHLNDHLTRDDLLNAVRESNKFIARRYGHLVDIGALLEDDESRPREDDPTSPVEVAGYVLARLSPVFRAAFAVSPSPPPVRVEAPPKAADTGPIASDERASARPTPLLLSERYELGEVLALGGRAEIHHGLDRRLGRDVAVKILRADLARDPQFQMRFRREAQNAAALNHPAIVALYDTGEVQSDSGPLPYIVMEYVDGQTLREIIRTRGPMSQKQVLEVMADVCAALDFSHRHQIIHRDVKPANIMLNRAGAVKVLDFGIARALGEGQNVTQTAAVVGTAQYMSPEQARGEAVDARSDVYAAGCVLYELLTGEPPFTGDSPVAVAYQHVREDPKAPSEVNPAVPPSLDAIVLKALSKNPANRYQSAAEMRSDLVRVLSGQAPLAPAVMSADERTAMMTAGPPAGPKHRLSGRAEEGKAPRARSRWSQLWRRS